MRRVAASHEVGSVTHMCLIIDTRHHPVPCPKRSNMILTRGGGFSSTQVTSASVYGESQEENGFALRRTASAFPEKCCSFLVGRRGVDVSGTEE